MSAADSVVIYRLGSLGDTVVALPCFHAIRRAFPHSRKIVLTNIPVSSKAAPLQTILDGGGFIDEAIAYPVGTRRMADFLRLRRELRATGADTLIYMAGGRGLARVRRDLLFFRLCGFKRIIGAPKRPADDHGRIDAEGYDEPEAERLARNLADIGPVGLDNPAAWDLRLTEGEEHKAVELLRPVGARPFIVINMGGKAVEKDWGEANWSKLLAALEQAIGDCGLIIVGAPDDIDRAQRLSAVWRGPVIDVCGALTPRESAAVMRRATLFVGHDSGPLHLAAAVQTPSVGIFGGYNRPRKWHPYGAGHAVIHESRGVSHITTDDVLAACLRVLGDKAADVRPQ